jgi:hypothetical protein
MIRVQHVNGSYERIANGVEFDVDFGNLVISDEDENDIAVFASGAWTHALLIDEDSTDGPKKTNRR